MAVVALTDRAAAELRELQDRIVQSLERLDGSRFREDVWRRPGGGGGVSRVLADGAVFEKAGVSYSDVHGRLNPALGRDLPGEGEEFRAVGVSLVLHPRSPRIPTVHANFRRIERGGRGWFGGGVDLTPCYVVPADAAHFHRTLREACDRHDGALYPRWKAWCDAYFYLPHRSEPRGIGGVFFDYLGAGAEAAAGRPGHPPVPCERDPELALGLVRDLGAAFLPAYLPIAEARLGDPWGERERRWQLVRRGRYVEFNLLYDRGTVFGLKTEGRVESILMSLPPEARWEYAHEPEAGSPEAESLRAILERRDWSREPA